MARGSPTDREAPIPAGLPPSATWSTPSEAIKLVVQRPNLRRAVITALIVGTILFMINQLDTVLAGAAMTATLVKTEVTYLVPFCMANVGMLLGTRRLQ